MSDMLEKLLGYDLQKVTDPKLLQSVMEKLRGAGHETEYWEAFKWYCALSGRSMTDPLERDFEEVLTAYEQLLTEKNQKNTKASYTRRKLARKSVAQCLEDWALDTSETPGFECRNRSWKGPGWPSLQSARLVAG